MKTHHMLIALAVVSTTIVSHSMNTKVKLPSVGTLKTYLQEYKGPDWFVHDDHPEISADIPKDFGDHEKSPSELKTYLWSIDTEVCLRCGMMQPSEPHDKAIMKTIYEIINLVFRDYPDLLKQINDIDYPASLKYIEEVHHPSEASLMRMFHDLL